MDSNQPTAPGRKNLLLMVPLILIVAGIFLLILPSLLPAGSSVPIDPIKDPARYAQSITETATGITGSIFIRMGGGMLLIFGIMLLVFGSIATMTGSIFSSIFGSPGHGGFMGQLMNRIFPPKQPKAKVCPGCGAQNASGATKCKFCDNGL